MPMPKPKPADSQTQRYEEKRDAIIAAAARLFNEQGVKGATLEDIAGSVGLVTNSVTYYYRKKEDLATACFLRSIAAFTGLATNAAAERGVAARLQAFFGRHAQLLADIEQGRVAPIVGFSDIRALPSPQAETVFAAYTDMFRRVRALLRGPETAQLSRDDLNARPCRAVGRHSGAFVDRPHRPTNTTAWPRVSDILLRGLASAGSAWQVDDGEEPCAWPATPAARQTFPRGDPARQRTGLPRRISRADLGAAARHQGSFYHHHDNKQDLIMDCFERTFAVVRQALVLAENGPGSGLRRACAAAHALVRYQLSEHGPLLRVSAISALPDPSHREHVRRTMHRLTERMANVVVDGMMDGSIRALDPAIAAQAVIAAVNAAAELHRWLPGATRDDVAELCVRPIFEGVLCAAGKSA
jgi:AcrR family transcriptional regulator